MRLQGRPQGGVIVGHGGGEGLAVGHFTLHGFAREGNLADLVLDHQLVEFGIGQSRSRGVRTGALKQIEQDDQQQRDDNPKREISQIIQGPSFSDGRGKQAPH